MTGQGLWAGGTREVMAGSTTIKAVSCHPPLSLLRRRMGSASFHGLNGCRGCEQNIFTSVTRGSDEMGLETGRICIMLICSLRQFAMQIKYFKDYEGQLVF
ncbi:hypothetical protein XENORESO_015999 [Xenotaenia resolanae]|uniref:Uncharacterized protein n=1 Tax=Xenotaenia resolanae TaxID=208358 RepID=A0ABV0X108_9TELE